MEEEEKLAAELKQKANVILSYETFMKKCSNIGIVQFSSISYLNSSTYNFFKITKLTIIQLNNNTYLQYKQQIHTYNIMLHTKLIHQ